MNRWNVKLKEKPVLNSDSVYAKIFLYPYGNASLVKQQMLQAEDFNIEPHQGVD